MTTRIQVRLTALCLLALATPAARAVDEAAVQKAIALGVEYLKQCQDHDGTWRRPQRHETFGATALAGLTLLECGVSGDDPVIEKAAQVLREASIPLTDTYSIALCIMFFDRLGDANDIPLIESLMVRLLAGQTADGGWTYECPNIGDTEVRRLKTLIKDRKASDRKPAEKQDTSESNRTAQDLPQEIQQQLAIVNRLNPGVAGGAISDNSNTQFGTLALWVGHRYGLPVERAVARLEARFRNSQNADGGWGYQTGLVHETSPAMTCAGLLGLAVAYGAANEATTRSTSHAGKEPRNEQGKAARDALQHPKIKPPRDPARDPSVRAGLLALGAVIGHPVGLRKPPAAPPAQAPALPGGLPQLVPPITPHTHFPNYYLLWSLERVAVVYGLKTIGNKDWYGWGTEIVLARQHADGQWNGGYPEGGVDTSFALLFLRRSNLAQDLTTSLRGKVQDPGEVKLKAGGVGGGELAKKSARSGPEPAKGGGEDKSAAELFPELLLPGQAAPRDSRSSRPAEKSNTDSEAARLSDELVKASPAQRDALLERLKASKGLVNTQALAVAIPQLTGTSKVKARDALAERISRMTVSTLQDKLQDEDLEIRRAAALAGAMKEEKKFVPNLIRLLEDPEPPVVRAAHVALKSLTARDFGPVPDASRAEHAKAVTAWKSWWVKQGGSLISPDDSRADELRIDKQKLQGAWVMTALERDGRPVPKGQLGNLQIRLIFAGEKVTVEYPDHNEVGTYKLGVTKNPKEIEVVSELETSKGIYTLEGDSLKICGVPDGEERPTEFATRPGTKQVLFVLKRQKP